MKIPIRFHHVTCWAAILFLCISSVSQGQTDGQWHQSIGTENLNMQALIFKGGRTFAGGATGAYVSTNGAVDFALSNTGNDSSGPTRGFASNSNFLFTCTSQGVFRSADNGATWSQKSSGLTDLRTSGIHYLAPYLIVVTPTGVFRSGNDGDSWVGAGLAATDVRCVTSINATLFVGANAAASSVYQSTDYGVTWAAANTGLNTTSVRAIERKGTTLFAAGAVGTGVFRSTDLGVSWTLLSTATGLPSSSYRGFASDDFFVFAGSFGGGVYYSADNGDTWTAINAGLLDLTIFDLELNDSMLVAASNTKGVFRYALANLPRLPAKITSTAMTPGGFRMTYSAQTGAACVLEYSDSLDGNWTFLRALTGTGSPVGVTDGSTPSPPRRFYRIKTQ